MRKDENKQKEAETGPFFLKSGKLLKNPSTGY